MTNLAKIELSPPVFPQANGTDTINMHDVHVMGNRYLLMNVGKYVDEEIGDEIVGYLCLNGDYSNDNNNGIIKSLPYYITPDKEEESSYFLLFYVDEISRYGAYQAKYRIISHGNERDSPTVNIKIEKDLISPNPSEDIYSVITSIPDQSDIIIGQTSYITITVLGQPNTLIDIKQLTVKLDQNIAHLVIWKTEKQWVSVGNQGAMTIRLSVDHNLDEQQHKEISYSINLWADEDCTKPIPNYIAKTITYNVKKVDPDVIIPLNVNNEYIQPPIKDNPVGKGKKSIIYYGSIVDSKGQALKNTQVIVSSALSDQIYSNNSDKVLVNIGNVPDTGNPTSITTTRDHGVDYFVINSDDNGNIKFSVYPKRNISARIDFKTGILGVTTLSYAASAYIFSDTNLSDDPLGPSSPNIYNAEQTGAVPKIPGSKGMKVGIERYAGYQSSDTLIFFMQGYEENDKPIQLKPIYRLDNIESLDANPFYFTYDQLLVNKPMRLYYLIAPASQDSLYSMASNFMYVGEPSDDGDNNDDGFYTPAEVYSSYSPSPFDLKNTQDNDRMYDNRLVTLDTINQYIKGGATITNTDPVGLYVVIKIAKNLTEEMKGLSPINSICTVTVNIDSATRQENKSYSPIQLTDNTNYYQVVKIPYCDLTRAQGWEDGIPAKLSFVYSITHEGATKNSKEWKATIGTANTGFDIGDDGCPCNDKSH
ncbi:hypothetical protein ID856_00765 [Xenorhabdus sp. 18]|uniref:hypothetical protein n=1 Tax=Xenorhabdus doucetiae TaxID=351671 RepID=UPI00198FD092|nr:hypothetical protein [Xenorhabdus sp. 18]MBD2795071.1 hypothetical protein [Xenorhabdus sp. 18]